MFPQTHPICAVILAAGEGKRMKSNRPKVLSEVLFKPMLRWVMDAAYTAGIANLCVVTGYGRQMVEDYLAQTCMEGLSWRLATAVQEQRLGTAHAVQTAGSFLQEFIHGDVLVLNGDSPFLDPENIQNAWRQHHEQDCAVTVISAEVDDPTGYGRIVRDPDTRALQKIVEQKDADPDTLQIREVNSGAYWFRISDLLRVLGRIGNQNAQQEYYLPDAIRLLLEDGKRAGAFQASSGQAVLGANDCLQLHRLNAIARQNILQRHLQNGVEIPCLDGVILGPDVEIGAHVRILPGTILSGATQIGNACVIGPHTCLHEVQVADGMELRYVQARRCSITETLPPFTCIAPPEHRRHPHPHL